VAKATRGVEVAGVSRCQGGGRADPSVSLLIRLRRDAAGRPVGQVAREGSGEVMDFVGWLELMTVVDALADRSAGEATGGATSSA
jgi:hypothetical protein